MTGRKCSSVHAVFWLLDLFAICLKSLQRSHFVDTLVYLLHKKHFFFKIIFVLYTQNIFSMSFQENITFVDTPGVLSGSLLSNSDTRLTLLESSLTRLTLLSNSHSPARLTFSYLRTHVNFIFFFVYITCYQYHPCHLRIACQYHL